MNPKPYLCTLCFPLYGLPWHSNTNPPECLTKKCSWCCMQSWRWSQRQCPTPLPTAGPQQDGSPPTHSWVHKKSVLACNYCAWISSKRPCEQKLKSPFIRLATGFKTLHQILLNDTIHTGWTRLYYCNNSSSYQELSRRALDFVLSGLLKNMFLTVCLSIRIITKPTPW